MATFPAGFSADGGVGDAAASGATEAEARPRWRDLVELAVGYGLILAVIWTPRPWQRVFYIAAILWIAAATWVSFDGWKVMGLRVGGMLRSLWVVGVALLVAAVAVMVASRLGTLNRPQGAGLFIKTFWGYAIWSFLQQFLLQDFVLLRLLRLLPSKGMAIAAATGLFALGHLPSPILTGVTVVWGSIACWLFLRYRNVFTLGLAHAVLGVCVAITVPGRVDHNMRVGLGYLRYHPHGLMHGQRSQSDHSVSTEEWVMAEDPMRRS
jgi:Type II CAAX prenyl endopeptidase Rce1-like